MSAEVEPISADGKYVQISVQTLSGEALLRTLVAADMTVGELLQRVPEGPSGLSKLLLGTRQLATDERLGDLEVSNAEQGLAITLLRLPVDYGVLGRIRSLLYGPKQNILSMARQVVGPDEVAALAYLLREPDCTLSHLGLNQTGVDDITPIAEALQVNRSLDTLDLGSTKVFDVSTLGKEGGRMAQCGVWPHAEVSRLEALQVNQSMVRLYLNQTEISEVGHLVEAIRVHPKLDWLYIGACPSLPAEAKQALREVQQERNAAGRRFYLDM